MAQNPRIIINAFNSGGEEALAETRDILDSIAKIYRHDAELPSKRASVMRLLPTILETVSSVNLLRYTMEDVRRIAEGKGGIGDMLDLSLNILFFLNRYKEQLKLMVLLGEINKGLMMLGALT